MKKNNYKKAVQAYKDLLEKVKKSFGENVITNTQKIDKYDVFNISSGRKICRSEFSRCYNRPVLSLDYYTEPKESMMHLYKNKPYKHKYVDYILRNTKWVKIRKGWTPFKEYYQYRWEWPEREMDKIDEKTFKKLIRRYFEAKKQKGKRIYNYCRSEYQDPEVVKGPLCTWKDVQHWLKTSFEEDEKKTLHKNFIS